MTEQELAQETASQAHFNALTAWRVMGGAAYLDAMERRTATLMRAHGGITREFIRDWRLNVVFADMASDAYGDRIAAELQCREAHA